MARKSGQFPSPPEQALGEKTAELFSAMGMPSDIRAAEVTAERLFDKERQLFYNICLKFGFDEAQRIFANQPKLRLSDKEREELNKELWATTDEIFLTSIPEWGKKSMSAKARDLLRWYENISTSGGTPEYRQMVALLATIVRKGGQTKGRRRGKGRYKRITREGIRKQLTRRPKKESR
jgi:hypothetical protein